MEESYFTSVSFDATVLGAVASILGLVVTWIWGYYHGSQMVTTLSELKRHIYPSRADLVKQWTAAANTSESSILAISYTVGQSTDADREEKKAWKRYLSKLKRKANSMQSRQTTNDHDGVKLLGPENPSRIAPLLKRLSTGAEVRVSSLVLESSLRFQISDKNEMILNRPFPTEPERPSNVGYTVKTPFLVKSCVDHFWSQWCTAKPLDDYIMTELHTKIPVRAEGVDGPTRKDLAAEFGLSKKEVNPFVDELKKQKKIEEDHDGRLYRN